MSGGQESYENIGRSTPQAVEAEVAFLGGVMQDANALSDTVSLLEPDDFFQERHRVVWEALRKLSQLNIPVGVVTLSAELEKDGRLETVGGRDYLLRLVESVGSAAQAKVLAELIRKKSTMRRLIAAATGAIREAEDPASEPDEIISKVEGEIMSLAERQVKDSLRPAGDVVQEVLKALENRKDGLSGCPTGFTDLDRLTNGLQPSDLIILAGRPGMGKSAFALTLAANSSFTYGKRVAFFSLEMGAEQLMQRILCSMAGIELSRFRANRLNRDEYSKLPGIASRIMQTNTLYVDDNLDLGIMELLSKCRSLRRKSGLDLVIVDYLQLMKTGREENRAVAVGAISRGLKILAKDLKIPVIALAQLSRKTEDRADSARGGKTRPQLSDLRESGSIEQDADMVWFIERPFYRSHDEADKNKAQLLVAKHRNGSTADIDLTWVPQYTRFENYVAEEDGAGMADANMGFGDLEG